MSRDDSPREGAGGWDAYRGRSPDDALPERPMNAHAASVYRNGPCPERAGCMVCHPYALHAVDRAGCDWVEGRFATFAELLAAARAYPKRRGHVLFATNDDRADEDFDGLTEDEREDWCSL